MTPADGSSPRGGSTSVRGRVRSPHISGGRPAAGSQRAYSLGWDRQTDGSRYRLMLHAAGHDKVGSVHRRWLAHIMSCFLVVGHRRACMPITV